MWLLIQALTINCLCQNHVFTGDTSLLLHGRYQPAPRVHHLPWDLAIFSEVLLLLPYSHTNTLFSERDSSFQWLPQEKPLSLVMYLIFMESSHIQSRRCDKERFGGLAMRGRTISWLAGTPVSSWSCWGWTSAEKRLNGELCRWWPETSSQCCTVNYPAKRQWIQLCMFSTW